VDQKDPIAVLYGVRDVKYHTWESSSILGSRSVKGLTNGHLDQLKTPRHLYLAADLVLVQSSLFKIAPV